MAGTLHRIQELFRQGEVVKLEPRAAKGPIYVWVGKLNALERDEAAKDARQARALRMIAFDRDPDEQAYLKVLLGSLDDAAIREVLLQRKSGELYGRAEDEVRSDASWSERLEAIDRASIATAVPVGRLDEHQQRVLGALLVEFHTAVQKVHEKLLRQELRELKEATRPELEETFTKAQREMVGANAFWDAKRQTEIWYALRDVQVEVDDEGTIASSKPGERLCATRDDVNQLPDEVLMPVIAVFDREMTSRDAGNSDAPPASSGSSERHAAEGESTPSTPSAT